MSRGLGDVYKRQVQQTVNGFGITTTTKPITVTTHGEQAIHATEHMLRLMTGQVAVRSVGNCIKKFSTEIRVTYDASFTGHQIKPICMLTMVSKKRISGIPALFIRSE